MNTVESEIASVKLGVRRNTPPSRDCGESVRDGERRLSIHSYCGGKSLCYTVLPRAFDMLRGNDTPQSLIGVASGMAGRALALPIMPSERDIPARAMIELFTEYSLAHVICVCAQPTIFSLLRPCLW